MSLIIQMKYTEKYQNNKKKEKNYIKRLYALWFMGQMKL